MQKKCVKSIVLIKKWVIREWKRNYKVDKENLAKINKDNYCESKKEYKMKVSCVFKNIKQQLWAQKPIHQWNKNSKNKNDGKLWNTKLRYFDCR
jgi:hypothetical protein